MNLFNFTEKYDWKILLHPKKFLLNNFGLKQTLVKNTFWLTFAEGISKIFKLVLFIYIARILGATEYGKFSFSLSFVNLFVIFSSLGIFNIVTREFAREEEKEKDFSAIFSLKIILTLLTYILIFIGSFFITKEHDIRVIIYILGAEVLLDGFLLLLYSFLRAREKMEYQALGQIIQVFLVTALGLIVLFFLPSVKNLSWAYFLGTAFAFVVGMIFFNFRIHHIKPIFNSAVWKKYLLMSYPLALASFVGTIHGNIDSTMLGSWGEITQTGWYNAAQRIVQAAFILVNLASVSFFPVLSKFFKEENKNNFQKSFDYFFIFVIFLVVPTILGGIVLAPRLIDLVYGSGYLPAVYALQITLVSTAIGVISAPFRYSLIAANQQSKIFWATVFSVVANIVLNLILIPRLSLYGASISGMISLSASLFLYFYISKKSAGINPFGKRVFMNFICAILASGIMAIIVSLKAFQAIHVIGLIFIGFLIYLIVFFVFKKFLNRAITL